MTTSLRRAAFAALLLTPFAATGASAQLTPEGTQITNTATVTYQDTNNNAYSPVSGSVTVVVGFLAAPDIQAVNANVNPQPGQLQPLEWTLTNSGNGIDQYTFAHSALPAGLSVPATGGFYLRVGAAAPVNYNTLAELNAALATTNVAAGAAVTVGMNVQVSGSLAGQTVNVSATQTSRRDNTKSDTTGSTITVTVQNVTALQVIATPTSNSLVPRTAYTTDFVVRNLSNVNGTYTLSVGSTSGASSAVLNTTSVSIPAGGQTTVTVTYNLLASAAGGTITVGAVNTADASITSSATFTVTALRPSLSLVKEAFSETTTGCAAMFGSVGACPSATRIDNSTAFTVVKDQYFWYRITVTNGGTSPAAGVKLADIIPVRVNYETSVFDAATWNNLVVDASYLDTAGTTTRVTADLAGNLADNGTNSATFFIRVRVK